MTVHHLSRENSAGVSAGPMRPGRHRIAGFVVWFLVVFLVLFPKGGIKVNEVPLTWGYLFLGFSLIPLIVVRLIHEPLRITRMSAVVLAGLVPFQFLVIYDFAMYGIASFGFVASITVAFFILPFAFLFVYPAFLDRVDGYRLAKLLRRCIFSTAVFGIFLFFWYPFAHGLIEVPYLTVNADDYGLIEYTKHIARGPFLKLISTYNNGNLYGVAMLILLPLYTKLEPRMWKRLVLQAALILTLSRTVWAGLILNQALSFAFIAGNALRTFPRVVLGNALKRGLFLIVTAGGVLLGLLFVSGGLGFFFDPQLGGRSGYFSLAISEGRLLPHRAVVGFLEVVYATALQEYGYLGLISFTAIFVTPVFILMRHPEIMQSPLRRAACKGLILYMIVAGVDGGIMLIPILAFYWFCYMILLNGWPGNLDLTAPSATKLPAQKVLATLHARSLDQSLSV